MKQIQHNKEWEILNLKLRLKLKPKEMTKNNRSELLTMFRYRLDIPPLVWYLSSV